MTDDCALMQAILADPDDDVVRLAYADWLEENGNDEQQARAEFIRVQIALSRMADDDPAWTSSTVREAALLNNYGEVWRRDVANLVENVVFRRGFIEEVSLGLLQLLENGGRLLDHSPILLFRRAPFLVPEPESTPLRDLANWRGLSRVRGLDLSQGTSLPGTRRIFQSRRANNLRRLDLGWIPFGPETGKWLCDAPALDSLRQLSLSQLIRTDAAFLELQRASFFPRLTHFGLSHTLQNNSLSIRFLESLVSQPPPHLTHLILSGLNLGDPAATRFARSEATTRLKELRLLQTGMRRKGLATLLNSPHVQGLTTLYLRDQYGHSTLQLVGDSPHLASLTRLGLYFSPSSCAHDLAHIANSPRLPRLRRLDLSASQIECEGIVALATSECAKHLTHLDLSLNSVNESALLALARSPYLRRLTHLNLTNATPGNRAIIELARSPILENVVDLNLRGVHLHKTGIEALAKSPYLGPHATLTVSFLGEKVKDVKKHFKVRVEDFDDIPF
jgi:uncharacterized protein (TIGR02996 family)